MADNNTAEQADAQQNNNAQGNNAYWLKLAGKMLEDGKQKAIGNRRGLGGMLLKGDPGVGKTTFIEIMSNLLGVNIITIEVPHIVEEHLINIPFLIYNPITKQEGSGTTAVKVPMGGDEGNAQEQWGTGQRDTAWKRRQRKEADEYSMVLADSNLYTQIQKSPRQTDEEYVNWIMSDNPHTGAQRVARRMYEAMGGSREQIPERIQIMRNKYKCLLFLDEYFRETPVRIRNILRDLMNGKIGKHQVPQGTYIIYASNMEDEGLVEIPHNTQFVKRVEFKAPTPDEWFTYLEAKYENDDRVQLKPEVVKGFKKVITEKTLSVTEKNVGVRSSPRRWEQLVLYVNNSLPVKSRDEALSLLTNIRSNFVNYETGKFSEKVLQKTLKVVVDLIKQTSGQVGEGVTDKTATEGQKWEKLLDHHLKQQRSNGKNRKYVAVISGLPGVGKTTKMLDIAAENNLAYIHIDVSRLNPEDVVGMPLPGERRGDGVDQKITVKFTIPTLLEEIEEAMPRARDRLFKVLDGTLEPAQAEERKQQFEQQEYRYLLFMDELNRVASQKTFNALRRVILEKNFGPKSDGPGHLKVPDDVIIVGAMNPEKGAAGTVSMTSHFRDVIDVIEATPSWPETRSFLLGKPSHGSSSEAREASIFIIDEFVKKFGSKNDKRRKDLAPYYLMVGSDNEMYVSPREYDALFDSLFPVLDNAKDRILDEGLKKEEGMAIVEEEVYEAIEEGLPFEKYKNVAADVMLEVVEAWLEDLIPKVLAKITEKHVSFDEQWQGVLAPFITGERPVTSMPNESAVKGRMDSTSLQEFVDEVSEAIQNILSSPEDIQKYVIDENEDEVVLDGKSIVHGKDKISKLGNALKALFFTLDIYKYQFDRIGAVAVAMYHGISATLKGATGLSDDQREVVIDAMAELRDDLEDALENIQDESS